MRCRSESLRASVLCCFQQRHEFCHSLRCSLSSEDNCNDLPFHRCSHSLCARFHCTGEADSLREGGGPARKARSSIAFGSGAGMMLGSCATVSELFHSDAFCMYTGAGYIYRYKWVRVAGWVGVLPARTAHHSRLKRSVDKPAVPANAEVYMRRLEANHHSPQKAL
jgi:hypothetical protein